MPSNSLTPDLQAYVLALVVGVIAGFSYGAIVLALSVVRSPRRGI